MTFEILPDDPGKDKPAGARLVANICFAGDCDGPNDPAAAAVALCRHGFEVSLMPETYRHLLAVEGDDFLEATKNISAAGGDDVQDLIDGMWAEVERLVVPYGGDVFECGEAARNHIPFAGFHDGSWL